MTTSIALFAPLPAEFVTAALDDVEVVEIRPSHDDPVERARGAHIAIADYSGEVRIGADIAAALAPTCELVQVPAAGLDSIDLDACLAAGIPVASCAGLNTVAVAEWVVWGTIDALRRLSMSDRALRSGEWQQLGEERYELAGKSVGIVGLGRIGTAAAERLEAFDVELLYWSRSRHEDAERRLGLRWRDLDDLVATVDALVLTVALTDDTRELLSEERIASMAESAVVVNAARGEVVDEDALGRALAEGRLHGAAIDVFSTEPPPEDHPLRGHRTAALTPHVGGTSQEAVGRIVERVFENITRVAAGRTPLGLVSP